LQLQIQLVPLRLGGGGASGYRPSPFVIKRLNDKLDSYTYAFQAATVSRESAGLALFTTRLCSQNTS
jgi:hypothetical protein